jgi:hypothetical protein
MKAQQFTEEFQNLMNRTFQSGEVPLQQIILELDKAHHNCLHVLTTIEANKIAQGIIPAGSIPPNFRPPKAPGQ